MKRAQIVGLGIAGFCAIGAAFFMYRMSPKPAQVVKSEVRTNTVDVLVAKTDIGLGQTATESSFRWQAWPQDAVPVGAITSKGGGNPTRDMTGSIARAPLMAGEPVTRTKLIKPGEGGVLASILPQGKRAVSAKIAEDTAAGRLILPNDRVDVILIRRERGRNGKEEYFRETLFRNIRILAIGQRIEVKDGQKVADGNTATMELTPTQAERLAQAKLQGDLSLALRSIADVAETDTDANDPKRAKDSDSIKTTRYGIRRANN
jgi:pilus assembly protein CpaB